MKLKHVKTSYIPTQITLCAMKCPIKKLKFKLQSGRKYLQHIQYTKDIFFPECIEDLWKQQEMMILNLSSSQGDIY